MKKPVRLRGGGLHFDLYQYILFHAESKSSKLYGVSFFPPLQTGLAQCGNFVFIFLRHIPASLCPLDFQIVFRVESSCFSSRLMTTCFWMALSGFAA